MLEITIHEILKRDLRNYLPKVRFATPLPIYTGYRYIRIKDYINHWRVEILYINKTTPVDVWT